MLSNYIAKLLRNEDLDFLEATSAFKALFESTDKQQMAIFLALLSSKGETVDELFALATLVRSTGNKIELLSPVLDIVGTGGDMAMTLNISTASALLVAKCGVPVLKTGSRAISSKCGTADVLEVLGYPINSSTLDTLNALHSDNFAFCLGQNYYPLLSKVREVRNSLGFPTIFNLLGPLLSLSGLTNMLIGVYDKKHLLLVSQVLEKLGTENSLVYNGCGLDELSCLGDIDAYKISGNKITKVIIKPEQFGLEKCILADLKGDDKMYNARIIYQTLSGIKTGLTDTLILNAAIGLFTFGAVSSIESGITLARHKLLDGNIIKANKLMQILINKTRTIRKVKSFKQAILSKKFGAVISELKRASPSSGDIATIVDPVSRARLYFESGAAVISVLTDSHFKGCIKDLEIIASSLKDTNAVILRKDFILYPEQISESINAGADVILLMVSVLGSRTKYMVDLAHEFGLEVLVEVHSSSELEVALASGCDVIGVNQRDLRDFSMHPELFNELITQLPKGIVSVAESGIKTANDAKEMFKLGFNAVLVGESLSRLDDPKMFFNELYSKC